MAPQTFQVDLPLLGTVEVEAGTAYLGLVGLCTFVVFFLSDPFNIIEKVDLRLVRLYKVPESGSAVKDKSYVCLVNPYSGNKDGLFQFHKVANKMLQRAGAAKVDLQTTTHAGHFGEIGEEMARKVLAGERAPDGGVLVFGGDGSLCEFVNGLVKAASGGTMDLGCEQVRRVLGEVKLGLVPVGSANGIAASYGAVTCYQAIEQIIAGGAGANGPLNVCDFDMNQVTFTEHASGKVTKFVDLHCVSWGIITDHDELVERKWRHLGKKLKMILAPLYVIARCKSYRGRVSFKPAMPDDAEEVRRLQERFGYTDLAKVPDHPTKKGWKVIEDDFIMASVCNLSWASYDVCIAPDMRFDDGAMALMLMRGRVTRLQLIRAFMSMGDGSASKLPFVDLFKASAVHFEADEVGSFGASGENIENTREVLVENLSRVGRFLKRAGPKHTPTQ